MGFSIDGLVSGFDTSSIIDGILQFQQTQLDLFNSRRAEISTRQSAFGGIEAQLLSLRSAFGRLNRVNSAFDATSATSSNEDILTVAASSDAANGNFALTVNQLATAEQRASQGFESENSLIGTGDITFRVGTRDATTVTIDESNNTLQGLADAINAATNDVSASIVFDQQSDSSRLLLTSTQTGEENTISIDSNLTGGDVPDFSTIVSDAQNSQVTLGSGSNPIVSEFSSNQVDGLITGVTLDLISANAGETVNVQISRDTTAAQEAIEGFVDSFNAVIDFIDDQTAFNPETNISSPLSGNRNVSNIQNDLLSTVIENVPGLDIGLSRLADIGVDIDLNGRLEIDSSQLDDALNGRVEGLDPSNIRNLFGLNGSSSIQGIEFLVGSDATVATGTPFEIDIIQAAEQATITGTRPLDTSTVIDSSNNTFSINFNEDTSVEFTLAEGTYTQEELADEIESVINNSSSTDARDVNVSVEGEQLVITTEAFGSAAFLGTVTGTAATALGFDGSESDEGVDVAGTFIVNGVTETAVGRGQILTGEEGNDTTEDLQVLVSLTPSQVVDGSEGEITVTRGITSQLDLLLDTFLEPETGTLATINEEFDANIAAIDESIARVNEVVESQRERLVREFAALESVLAELQNTGNVLASQLTSIQAN